MRYILSDALLGLGRALLFYILLFFLFLFGVIHHVSDLENYLPVIIWMIFFLSNFFLIDALFKKDIQNGTFAHFILNPKLFKKYIMKQMMSSLFIVLLYVLFAITMAHFFVAFDQVSLLKYLSVLLVSGIILLFSGLLIHVLVMCSKQPLILYFICYIPLIVPVFLFSLGVLYDPGDSFLTSQFYYLLSIMCFVSVLCPLAIQKIVIQLVKGKL